MLCSFPLWEASPYDVDEPPSAHSGSAGGEGDFDAAERSEIGGDVRAVPSENHAGP